MQVILSPIKLYKTNFTTEKKQLPKLQTLSYDTFCFRSKNTNQNPLWNDFQKEFKKAYPNQTLENVMQTTTKQTKNRLGRGAHKIVYNIDKLDDYVLAFYWDRKPKKGVKFQPLEDPFPSHNFGQEIAYNGANMAIMKKIKGDVHMIPNWTKKYENVVYNNASISKSDAKIFMNNLSKVADLPLDSYVDFAEQVRYLTDKNIKMDLFNPNNIIIDYKNKKMTHFDLFEKPENFHCLGPELNGVQDMVNILSDALLQGDYAKVLDENEIQLMIEKTLLIAEKCEKAGEIAGLSKDRTTAIRTYKYLQQRLIDRFNTNNKYMEQYKFFHDTYQMD